MLDCEPTRRASGPAHGRPAQQAEEAGGLLTLAGDEDVDLEVQMDAALCGNELQVYAQVRDPALPCPSLQRRPRMG